ncbi:ribonuclease H-like [Halyomorpha halys]|uniref:ribonuclease H-like n=1 Tax=Halyomorpha halys TaxID=286706 RepID=UPI0006D4F55E|nr:uncharacterized protein LOC106683991 [Halyomorpha halys]
MNTYDSDITDIYTDGSKVDGNVGCAWTDSHRLGNIIECQYMLASRCSNNQAEKLAILKTLENLLENTYKVYFHIVLHIDNMNVLHSLNNTNIHDPLTEEIRLKILQLQYFKKSVEVKWVKGHSGIEGNERADSLAKEISSPMSSLLAGTQCGMLQINHLVFTDNIT